MRAGDVVFHRPSRETWVLAWAEDGEVSACGWPESVAKESDCLLVECASDAEHKRMLEHWALTTSRYRDGGGLDRRSVVCARQLAQLEQREAAERKFLKDIRGVSGDFVGEECRVCCRKTWGSCRTPVEEFPHAQECPVHDLRRALAAKRYAEV